jgi:glyoxylase-like metal-dependent hydrolase (beta-lactamase superfamily II)
MKIICYPLGELQANCYFLISENNLLLVDPADEASFILEEIQRQRLNLVAILETHGHFDHIMAVGEIQKSFDAPLFINKKDQFLVDRLEETAKYFLDYNPIIFKPKNIKYISENIKTFHVSRFTFHILFAPGHTPGGVCFYFEKEKQIFTGDTLFKGAIGRYDFSYSNKDDLKKSLNKILRLPDKVIVYPGHGEETIIKNEKNIIKTFF